MRPLVLVLALAACNGTTDTDTSDTDTDAGADTEETDDTETSDDEPTDDTDVAEDTDDTDVPTEVSTDGLFYLLHFDGNLTDAGPNGLSLLSGEYAYTADRHGADGKAMGSGACLRFGSQTYDASSGEFTFSAWLRPGADFDNGSRHAISSVGGGFYQLYWTDGTARMEVYQGGDTRYATSMTASMALTEDTWTHVAFAFDVTNGGTFYVNGDAVTTSGSNWATEIQSSTSQLYVGCAADANFDADYDEVGLWFRRLHPAEIALLAAE